MALESLVKPKGYWKDLENILSELKTAINENNLSQFPSSSWLQQNDYNMLYISINKYHGGYLSFRDRFSGVLIGNSQNEKLEQLLENYAG